MAVTETISRQDKIRQWTSAYAVAGLIALLLLTGIRSAWVLTLWIASNRDKTKT